MIRFLSFFTQNNKNGVLFEYIETLLKETRIFNEKIVIVNSSPMELGNGANMLTIYFLKIESFRTTSFGCSSLIPRESATS